SGACTEQPFEETVHPDGRFKEKTGIAGYPVKALAGLLFAYLGPQPAPELPLWEPLTWEHAVRDICLTNLPCNWLQCQENSLDPVHVEWMHTYFGRYIEQGEGFKSGKGLLTLPTHQKIGFDVFEYGIIKRRVLSGFTEEDDDWAHGHPVMFPNILMVGSEAMVTFQFRVPVDDENTYHVSLYSWRAAPGAETPKQESVPYRNVRLYNDDGSLVTDYLFNQDYMGWVTQGPIAKRDREKLGESDKGIILFRRQLADQLEILADGGEPMNVFHNPGEVLKAPIEGVKFGLKRALDYRPGEAGFSRDGELITRTLQTWQTTADAGRGANR
ncbi:MAG: aromatic ring-hydroxylating dioxygenase subunit alpha, partial [Chloroflexota bacterium]